MKTKQQILILYHADCLDGFASVWVAFCQFGDTAKYIAMRFDDKFPAFNEGSIIYCVDFCFAPEIIITAAKNAAQIIIIDHHITAMTKYETFFKLNTCPDNIELHFDMSHSACILTWQYFFKNKTIPQILLHIEDRDLWLFKLNGTKEITSALYEQMPIPFHSFAQLNLDELIINGRVQIAQFSNMVNRLSKNAHSIILTGEKGLAVNAPSFFASELGHLLAEKSGTFGMTYQYDGRKKHWIYALRSIGEFNVGAIAQTFGGGGHINASGFSLVNNPFLPVQALKKTPQKL